MSQPKVKDLVQTFNSRNASPESSPRPSVSRISPQPFRSVDSLGVSVDPFDEQESNPFSDQNKVESPEDPFVSNESSPSYLQVPGEVGYSAPKSVPLPPRRSVSVESSQSRSFSFTDARPSPPPLPPRPKSPPKLPSSPSLRTGTTQSPLILSMNPIFNSTPPVADMLKQTDVYCKGAARCIAMSSMFVCMGSGNSIKITHLSNEALSRRVTLPEGKKVVCAEFIGFPGSPLLLWVGSDKGEIFEIDVARGTIVTKRQIHTDPISAILKGHNSVWSLDVNGRLKIWSLDAQVPSLLATEPRPLRLGGRTERVSMVNGLLWKITGNVAEIFDLSPTSTNLLLKRITCATQAGNISSIAHAPQLKWIILAHEDGNLSIWNSESYAKISVISVSSYMITAIYVFHNFLWVGFVTGKVNLFEIEKSGLYLRKEFQAFFSDGISDFYFDSDSLLSDNVCLVGCSSDKGQLRVFDGLLSNDRICIFIL